MRPINALVSWFVKRRLNTLANYWHHPIDIQKQTLLDLMRRASATTWGGKHGFSSVKTIADFKKANPILDYEDYKPYIERLMEGEQNLLWPSKIKWFAKSSGTTSDKSKFIPLSKEAMKECHYRASTDTMGFYCQNNPDTKVFTGKGIIMGGSHQISEVNASIRYGDLSAVLLQNLSSLGRYLTSIDLEIALMDEWEEKIERLANQYLEQDVTSISGVPTWTVVLIKRIFEKTGKSKLNEVWPNLELYIHGGVSFQPYQEQFEKLIANSEMNYVQTYNASEGFFGIQDQKKADDLLLMIDYGVFYEFMPLEELGKDNPITLQLDNVELNKHYALIISTSSGLWRYMIGDTVQFTSLRPFRIKVSGRTKQYLNTFGEEVMVYNTDKALAIACQKHQLKVIDYTVAPIYMSNQSEGGHEWLIEFENIPDAQTMEQFTIDLDKALQNLNSDYEGKRYKSMALKLPLVHAIPNGVFHKWLKSKGKLGGQHKVPRLSNSREYIEGILNCV